MTTPLTSAQMLQARAADVLLSSTDTNLRHTVTLARARRADPTVRDTGAPSGNVYVPRHLLADLLLAVEDVNPGLLNRILARQQRRPIDTGSTS